MDLCSGRSDPRSRAQQQFTKHARPGTPGSLPVGESTGPLVQGGPQALQGDWLCVPRVKGWAAVLSLNPRC